MSHFRDNIYHQNHPSVLVQPSKIVGGNLNPLNTRIIKKVVNINSTFRDLEAPTLWPHVKCPYESKWSSSNFIIRLPTVLDNVVSMTLSAIEVPNSLYTFSAELKTNIFTIVVGGSSYIIEVIPGNYDSEELLIQINRSLSDAGLDISANMDQIYGRTFFYSPSGEEFELDFRIPDDPNRDIRLNLGWILGYRRPYYYYNNITINNCSLSKNYIDFSDNELTADQEESIFVDKKYADSTISVTDTGYPKGYVSEGFIDTGGPRYLFFVVDDFNNSVNDQYISLVSKTAQLPSSNILARIAIPQSKHEIGFDDLADFIPKKREYFGPVRIDKLHFKLVDEFGRIVNLNYNEITFLLEFEVIYNL